MENSNTVICFSKTDGFENPPQKIDGFGQTRWTPSDDSTEKNILGFWLQTNICDFYRQQCCRQRGFDGFDRTRQFFEEGSRTRQFLTSKQQYFNIPLGFWDFAGKNNIPNPSMENPDDTNVNFVFFFLSWCIKNDDRRPFGDTRCWMKFLWLENQQFMKIDVFWTRAKNYLVESTIHKGLSEVLVNLND